MNFKAFSHENKLLKNSFLKGRERWERMCACVCVCTSKDERERVEKKRCGVGQEQDSSIGWFTLQKSPKQWWAWPKPGALSGSSM